MTEVEAISTLNEISEVIATFASLWASFTFGYLTVSYFVGAALTKFQCLIISTLYLVIAAFFSSAAIGHVMAWHLVRLNNESLYDRVFFMGGESGWVWGSVIFLFFGTGASLYFMYNIRNTGNG